MLLTFGKSRVDTMARFTDIRLGKLKQRCHSVPIEEKTILILGEEKKTNCT
jgi:hypothetical protein